MSLNVSLGTALSGLLVNQKAIQTASQNVANAQTEGYSRQTVARESVAFGDGGGGVQAASIERAADSFLAKEQRNQATKLGAADVRTSYFTQTQDLFGQPGADGNLSSLVSTLTGKIDALALNPQSGTSQLDVVSAVGAVLQDVKQLGGAVQGMRLQADRDIAAAVGTVNDNLQTVYTLNRQIAAAQAKGDSIADLQDQRDQAIDKISQVMPITTFSRPTGETVIYGAGGQVLVDGLPVKMDYQAASQASPTSTFGEVTIGGVAITKDITGGKLRALVDMRDTTLGGMQAQLDGFASQLKDTLNQAHNRGTALPPPATLTGTRPFAAVATDTVTLSDPVRIAVMDQGGTIKAYADIPAGSYTVANLRDAINAALPGAATATAADGTGLGLAATNPAYGIGIVDLAASGGDMTVTAGAKTYAGFSSFFGLNDLVVRTGTNNGSSVGLAQELTVRGDIQADPAKLARGRLTAATVPAPVVNATLGVASGDAGAVQAIGAALDAKSVFAPSGNLPLTQAKLSDYAAQIIARNAADSADATQQQSAQKSIVDGLKARQSSMSGVSIDEEMSNLISFQNAYAASARVISTISQMYDILTNLGNR